MAKALRRGGFPSIFHDKRNGSRYQGVLTAIGSEQFERERKALAALTGKPVKRVTDADVMEAMARGGKNTVLYLEDPAAADAVLKKKA